MAYALTPPIFHIPTPHIPYRSPSPGLALERRSLQRAWGSCAILQDVLPRGTLLQWIPLSEIKRDVVPSQTLRQDPQAIENKFFPNFLLQAVKNHQMVVHSPAFTFLLSIYKLYKGLLCGLADKESACNVGDLGLIPGLGRSPGEGKGYPLQYSGLENSMDSIILGVTKSRTWLSDFHFLSFNLGQAT